MIVISGVIEDKVRRFEARKRRERQREDRRSQRASKLRHFGYDAWKSLNTFTIIGIIVVAVPTIYGAGFLLGSSQYDFSTSTGVVNMVEIEEEGQVFEVDGYDIALLPEDHEIWQNNSKAGFTFSYSDEKIVIKGDRRPRDIYETCVHEKIHNLGTNGGDTYEHEMTEFYDDRLFDPTCLQLLYNIQAQTGDTR